MSQSNTGTSPCRRNSSNGNLPRMLASSGMTDVRHVWSVLRVNRRLTFLPRDLTTGSNIKVVTMGCSVSQMPEILKNRRPFAEVSAERLAETRTNRFIR